MKLIITTIFLATSSLFAQMSLKKPGNVGIETTEENQYIGKLSNYSKIIYHQVKTESDIRTVVDSKQPWSKTFLNIKGEWHIQFLAKAKPTFETVCKQKNIHIGMRLDSIFSGYVAYQKLDELLQIPSLEYLEFGIPVKPAMAAARSETGVDAVHQGGSSYGASKKGEGVIIGIVDIGFDYTHPNFLDSAGNNCRISHVWEQNTSGSSNVRWGYGYGKEYKTNSSIKNRQHDQNLGSHATHVMGIAGGSSHGSSGQRYLGVAPNSELIAVSSNFSNIGILEGIDYVFNIADSLDKPAVVNLSIGGHIGPHDGTSAFDISLKSLVKKSRIVVGAAGNEGEDSLHLQHTFSTSDSILYAFVQLNGGNTRPGGKSVLDIWGENKKDFRVSINLVNLSTNKFEDFTPYYRASTTNSN